MNIRHVLTASTFALGLLLGACAPDDNLPGGDGTPGMPTANDRDGDGTLDNVDKCIDQPGPVDNFGCPKPVTSPDRDGDGIADSADKCPDQPGPATNNGCPVQTPSDRDGDGVPDATDKCPDQAGPATNNGCPIMSQPMLTDAICKAQDQHYPTACNGECVSTVQDSLNCGSCGHKCGVGESCENSLCKATGSSPLLGAWLQNGTTRTLNLTVGHTELGKGAVEEQIMLAPGAWWGNATWTGVYASENPWKDTGSQETVASCQEKFNGKGRRGVVFETNDLTSVGRCEFKMDGPGNL